MEGENINRVYLVTCEDGTKAIYKPISGELPVNEYKKLDPLHPDNEPARRIEALPPGGFPSREVAMGRLDEELGFRLVPTTIKWDGPEGPGSLQRFAVNADDSLPVEAYTKVDQQRMAVLDYVSGNTDRHPGNHLTGEDTRPVAIDGGSSFPETDDIGLRSGFVAAHFDRHLESEVLQQVQSVDPQHLAEVLRASGLDDKAVSRAVHRLREIQGAERITGEAWHGRMLNANRRVFRGSMP